MYFWLSDVAGERLDWADTDDSCEIEGKKLSDWHLLLALVTQRSKMLCGSEPASQMVQGVGTVRELIKRRSQNRVFAVASSTLTSHLIDIGGHH